MSFLVVLRNDKKRHGDNEFFVGEHMKNADGAQAGACTDRVLTHPEVLGLTKLGRTTIWRLEREGRFPKRVKISAGKVGWRLSEIQRWISEL